VEDYRQAIVAMAEGKTALEMEQLDAIGWIHEGKQDYLREAAKAWLARSHNGQKADEVVCVSPTWEENFALSREIRDRLKAAGHLGDSVTVTFILASTDNRAKAEACGLRQKNLDLVVTPTTQLAGLEHARSYRIKGLKVGGFVKLEGGYILDAHRNFRRFDVGGFAKRNRQGGSASHSNE
jgi:hypothetical protein